MNSEQIPLPCNVLKKYFPLILLVAAIALIYWVKTHQRGPRKNVPVTTEIPAIINETPSTSPEPFDRTIPDIIYSKHAQCRMLCRHIDELEVKEILAKGGINYDKIESDAQGKTYPLEGITHDSQHVRIVVAPHQGELVIVTVIDLDTAWPCNCK